MNNKPVVGRGHQGNTPNLPVIREVDTTNDRKFQLLILNGMQKGTRHFKMGRVGIFISPPQPEINMGWHMSINHPERYPTWDEVAAAWYQLVPDADNRVGVMILPRRADYISIANYCFQVHEELEKCK